MGIYNSFKNLIEIIKPDFKKIINDVLEESIGEIVSTKAVIHDIGRNYKISDEDRKSVMKRIFKRMRKVEKISPEDTEFEKFYGKKTSLRLLLFFAAAEDAGCCSSG